MSGSVSYSCVRNCYRTFAVLQNLCTLGSQATFWYEEGISKLMSSYDKCLNVKVTMWRSRWRCVIKPAYSVSFLLSINIIVWQNVLYFPNGLRNCCIERSIMSVHSAALNCISHFITTYYSTTILSTPFLLLHRAIVCQVCQIWSCLNHLDEGSSLWDTMPCQLVNSCPAFWRSLLPPSSGSK